MAQGTGDRDQIGDARPVGSGRRIAQVIAILPVIAWAALMLLDEGFLAPLYQSPPEALGVPLGVVVLIVTAGWAAIGLALIQTSRSGLIWILAVVVFTLPALFALLLEPGVILIIRGLAA